MSLANAGTVPVHSPLGIELHRKKDGVIIALNSLLLEDCAQLEGVTLHLIDCQIP